MSKKNRLRVLCSVWAVALVIPHLAIALSACPGTYSSEDCDISGGGPAVLVCSDSMGTWYCDAEFSSSADKITAVHGDSGTFAWGDVNGTKFCCNPENAVTHIVIDTEAGDDIIKLTWDGAAPYMWEGTSYIEAKEGDDAIGGSDYECGTAPCDEIYPGAGQDETRAGDGDDEITEPVDDSSTNTLYGGGGDDVIYGGGASDTAYGGDDNDVIYGYGDADTLWGNEGDDELYGGNGGDVLRGGDGIDRIEGGAGVDIAVGDADNDTVCGGTGADTVNGGTGTNTCEDGSDTCSSCAAGSCTGADGTCP